MSGDPLPSWLLQQRRQVGERVRQLRMQRHMTQEALAERAELDPKTITRIERATYPTSVDNLIRAARGLGVPPRALFDWGA